MQDVCNDNYQVKQTKGKFLPPFYHLPFKQIIWQHLVWSVHNTYCSPTLSLVLFYNVPPRWWCLNKHIFTGTGQEKNIPDVLPFDSQEVISLVWYFFTLFSVFQKMLVYAFLLSMTLLCLHRVSQAHKWLKIFWMEYHLSMYKQWSFPFILSHNLMPLKAIWVDGMCHFLSHKFEHFYSMFVEISFDMNLKEYTLSKWTYCCINSQLFFQCVDVPKFFMSQSITGWILNNGPYSGSPLAVLALLLFRWNIDYNARNLYRDIPTEAVYRVWIIRHNLQ
jgi:hypothetical protein